MSAANLVDASSAPGLPGLPDRYRIGEKLGEGASGETYSATADPGGEACVVKVFATTGAAALAELRALGGISHPAIVRVREVGRLREGRPFLVTDRVVGPGIGSIATIADEGERRRALEGAAVDLAQALAHLHGRGLVHGDVAPANVRLNGQDPEVHAVLIDFGLAGPPGGGEGGARGTLGYAAPEALTGVRSPAADLFGVGATLFEAWTGAAPFGRGLPAVQRMLAGTAPSLSSVRPGLGPGWDRLMARLLAAAPDARPQSARELLRELLRLRAGAETPIEIDLAVPHPDGDPLQGIVVGRRTERAAVRAALDRLAEGNATASTLCLVGAPGSGRRTVFETVAREVAIAGAAGAMPPLEIWRGNLEALVRYAGSGESGEEAIDPAADESRAAERRLSQLAEALERKAVGRPLCVWLEEGPEASAFARIWAGAPPSGRALVVLARENASGLPFTEVVALAPFGEIEIGALLAAGTDLTPPPEAARAIARAAQGNAAVAAVLARRLGAGLRAGESTFSVEPGADLDRLLENGYRQLPAPARALVLALALAEGREGDLLEVEGEGPGEAAARAGAAGWIERAAGGALRLPSAAHRRAALAAADPEVRTQMARRALRFLDPGDPRRPDVLVAAGDLAGAAASLRRAAAVAMEIGEAGRAALLLERAIALLAEGEAALGFEERMALAAGHTVLGRYDRALEIVRRAAGGTKEPARRVTCLDREAWLLTRSGDLEGARSLLSRALAEEGDGTAGSPELRARLGRLLVTGGRFEEALAQVEPLLSAPATEGATGPRVAALARESAVLAHAYLGRFAAARTHLEAAGDGLAMPPGRRAYLEGLVAQLAAGQNSPGEGPGNPPDALAAYRRAFELASTDGDVHTVGAVALNLGALLAGEGLYGEALAMSERAVRALGRVGGGSELVTALVNAANLFVLVGDLAAARRALDRGRARASAGQVALFSAPAAFVEGDLARREGDQGKAAAHYREAARGFLAAGQAPRAASALSSAAEALALGGAIEEARRALADAEALRPGTGRGAAPDGSAALELARAQATLALADVGTRPAPELAERVAGWAAAARRDRKRPEAWRLAALAARLAERVGDEPRARAWRALATEIFEEVRMATPELHRPGLGADPDALWLRSAPARAGEEGVGARAQAAEARLRRLLRINKRLNSELRLPRLLEMVIDTVIELTDAERGFILLEDDSGTLEVKVARNIDQRTLETAELELSRSIARQAAIGGEPIVTIDAAGDTRFKEALSVSDLHLRSVLAVPLSIKGRVAGTIYVDHRLRRGAFNDEDVRLVLDFAEQAAIALENARLLAELRRRERQVEALNRRLEVELAARREELSGIKQELRDNREALAVRYDYRNIIGRTPRMLDLFRLLDRITDTTLPVVIQGESGTGKELVARAIHSNGPRRDRPFVGENCAAIPETLLESTLFGYVRGAFTGADHDTRGLFEIADGGTLFLDEVGEMSPAMQGKLLRVLQEGELRRVGSERTRKIDVRIVTATNRDLARMVDEGKFRRDLYFRLNVASIVLPALRERRDDIPLIVEHFLNRLGAAARRPPKPIDPQVLARLVAYRWPGNVRELENEITRADALSGERITVGDLSPQVAAAGDPGAALAVDPDSLLLKPRVERLERSLLREALSRAGGNQTRAAELLGLSRFGLQKKLKRYAFGSAT